MYIYIYIYIYILYEFVCVCVSVCVCVRVVCMRVCFHGVGVCRTGGHTVTHRHHGNAHACTPHVRTRTHTHNAASTPTVAAESGRLDSFTSPRPYPNRRCHFTSTNTRGEWSWGSRVEPTHVFGSEEERDTNKATELSFLTLHVSE